MEHRVLAATINYDHPQRGMLHALTSLFGAGNVAHFDYWQKRLHQSDIDIRSEFVELARTFQPTWLWLQLQNTGVIDAESIAAIRSFFPNVVATQWMGDCRSELSPYLASICKATDITFVATADHHEPYYAAGAPCVDYLQHGLDWEEDVLGIPTWEPPFRVPAVVFCGSYYAHLPGSALRIDAIRELVKAGIDVGVVGSGWPEDVPCLGTCTVKQQHHVWKRAKIGISVGNFTDRALYYSDRPLIAMAAGTCVVQNYVPRLEEEFVNRVETAWFKELSELVPIVSELLEDDARRTMISKRGRTQVLESHTWFSRFASIIPIIESIRAAR